MFRTLRAALGALMIFVPMIAHAHEVYVLTGNEITVDTTAPPFDMIAVVFSNLHQFIFWGFIAFVTVSTVFFMSIFRVFEEMLDPFLARLKPYAPAVSRITIGLGFVAASYFGATFGPELPLAQNFGAYAPSVSVTLAVIGVLIIIGFWARAAALIALVLYGVTLYQHGSYMLTYANYLGEILVLLLIGSHRFSVHSCMGWHERFHRVYHTVSRKFAPYSFVILRVCFGISLIYASSYAKIIHNNLALQIASLPLAGHSHSLAYYFGFEPHFLVLGAAIIELLIGLFFVFGIEIRWTSLFLLFWLALSLWYFGEMVWPHIILIGIPIALIFHGYDRYSLEGYFFKRHKLEPVL